MLIKKIFILCTAGFILVGLFVSIKNTHYWARDFYGLITLVTIDDEQYSANPFSQDFFWISSDMAEVILTSLEYPYENCYERMYFPETCNEPKIVYAGRMLTGTRDEIDLRYLRIVKHLIERGEPINDYASDGFTALHSAILQGHFGYAKLVLDSGADPLFEIRSELKIGGMNAIDFVDFLYEKNPDKYAELRGLIHTFAPNKRHNQMDVSSLRPFGER